MRSAVVRAAGLCAAVSGCLHATGMSAHLHASGMSASLHATGMSAGLHAASVSADLPSNGMRATDACRHTGSVGSGNSVRLAVLSVWRG
jgi:hypothetical protein